ncbi:hypothetical protein, partial [Ectopseudomonas hydrolytica]|uniref:hypothetical protein n=1 Tax=Ectopseudomonas hydrolytica TaxID=2493633 RepID=UPI003C2B6171
QDVLQALLEAVPLEEWVVALKGAEPELVRAIAAFRCPPSRRQRFGPSQTTSETAPGSFTVHN